MPRGYPCCRLSYNPPCAANGVQGTLSAAVRGFGGVTPPEKMIRSFRIVAPETEQPLVQSLLRSQGFGFEPEPFSAYAWRLTEEPFPLGRSLAAFFGFIYIQDRSSMLPPLALNPAAGAAVLDMCASPGSKTGFLAQLVGQGGLVLGNEPTRTRLNTLRRNLQVLNLHQAATCSWPGEELAMADADASRGWDWIQLDPPCSGWGTTDKNPQVRDLWHGDKVKPLVGLQRLLLRKAERLLRPGGRLVFSTCTTNVDENEEQVRFVLGETELRLTPLTPPPGFVFAEPHLPGCEGVLRVDEASDGQGFFIAAFVKPGKPDAFTALDEPATAKRHRVDDRILAEAGLDASKLAPGEVAVFGDSVHFLPEQALQRLPSGLRWQGAPLGKVSGGRPLFSPRLRGLDKPDFPRLTLEKAADIEGLLQGQSFSTSLAGKEAALYWNDLHLGRVRLKNGRALWTEK